MLSAQSAIVNARRGITLGMAVKILLWTAALTAAIAGPIFWPQINVTLALFAVAGVWIFLSVRSAKAARMNADLPMLVASGQFDQAESQIDQALRTFSLFRPAKLAALHQLAVLRHAQDRHGEAAVLCKELLTQKLGLLAHLGKSAQLILAQSSLELNDLRTAAEALQALSGQPLSIGETLNLIALQLDYQSRIGAWPAMFERYMSKVQLAEVMPAAPAAVSQALLALAAKKIGRDDASNWLAKRAALLADVQELVKQRPMLKELWPVIENDKSEF
jgi:hypothetical protein